MPRSSVTTTSTTTTITTKPTAPAGSAVASHRIPSSTSSFSPVSSSFLSSISSAFPAPPVTFHRPFRTGGNAARKAGSGFFSTASSPNLRSLYLGSGGGDGRVPPFSSAPRLAVLARKVSLAALTPTTLASIPDVSETYGIAAVLTDVPTVSSPVPSSPPFAMTPLSPTDDANGLAVGDVVDVPGNMQGTVRFVGSVQGKKGIFAGVELHSEFASRGKNNGEVDGISYFATATPNAGIFLPASKALRPINDPLSPFALPTTPVADFPNGAGLKAGTQNSTNYTPPTPSLPKFSASVGPGRATSPFGKRPRPSMSRPESPSRRLQSTPGARSVVPAVPAVPPMPRVSSRYVSPAASRFAQSVRGTAGDPTKKTPRPDRPPVGTGLRSASALGQVPDFDFDATTPLVPQRTRTLGSMKSISALNQKMRPPSRAHAHDDEVDRLRGELEDRDRQLREQAASLAEMETSLAEVQSLMEGSENGRPRRTSLDNKNVVQLRTMLREKNEKMSMLAAEFDVHRADFRSTIDALETASTETQKLYEKRIEELMQEVRDLETSRLENLDVNSVASQLKHFGEMVQELEEGLEDARRGEAEACGEVEFLRGEVERTRAELRRERERASALASAATGGPGAGVDAATANGKPSTFKELEHKEDEIRGLKAIIHSLSRDSVPNSAGVDQTMATHRTSAVYGGQGNDVRERKLERQVIDLQTALEEKIRRETDLERELETIRREAGTAGGLNIGLGTAGGVARRSSLRDSRDTIVLARGNDSRPVSSSSLAINRPPPLDSMPESDAYSTATENSTLWCEMCEANGHDILSCNKFDSGTAYGRADSSVLPNGHVTMADKPAPLSPVKSNVHAQTQAQASAQLIATTTVLANGKLPGPMEAGPAAGKYSGVVDLCKWCAICERDGHDSVDCPYEDDY